MINSSMQIRYKKAQVRIHNYSHTIRILSGKLEDAGQLRITWLGVRNQEIRRMMLTSAVW